MQRIGPGPWVWFLLGGSGTSLCVSRILNEKLLSIFVPQPLQ